ncbi:hypothetical protein JW710_02425 [Candidatus Dojkabacteria bacterium]|nr:hypothetical protein [Candidatus Dojkabacteria bacterium]
MELRSRILKVTDYITQYGVFVMTLLLPVMFLPFTSEFYEFNKSMLFISFMLIILVAWLVNISFKGQLSFWKTSFDVGLIAIFASVLLSFVFSEDKITSLIGFSGRMSEGVVVLFFMLMLTIVLRHVVKTKRVVELFMWGLTISGALVGLISTLQYFGIYIFSAFERYEFSEIRSFSSVGSDQVLPFFFLILIPVGFGLLISKTKNLTSSIFALITLMFNLCGFIISTGNFWSWPGALLWSLLIASVVLVLMSAGSFAKSSVRFLLPILVFVVLVFIVRNVDTVSNALVLGDDDYINQPRLQYDVSWSIATETLSKSAGNGLLGSGPDTFAYDFTRYRPESYNETDNWSMRFSRSSSQILEILGNTGVLGLAAWGALFTMIVVWLVRIYKENHVFPFNTMLVSLSSSILLVIISSLFVFFTINIWYLLWMMLGFTVALRALSNPRLAEKVKLSLSLSKEKIAVEENDILPYVMLVPAVVLLLGGGIWVYRMYRGEVYYQNALYEASKIKSDEDDRIEKMADVFNGIGKAIDTVGYRDSYRRDYAVMAINILKEYANMESESEETSYQDEMKTMLSVALESGKKATDLSPINVRNWESRIYIYQELIKITNGGYGDAALASINRAIEYDPYKPQLHHQKGVILSLAGYGEESLDELKRALTLQPLLLDARYDLAVQYQKMGNVSGAREQLQIILNILDSNGLGESDAYTQVLNALNSLGEGQEVTPEGSEDIEFPQENVEENSDNGESNDAVNSDTDEEEVPQ